MKKSLFVLLALIPVVLLADTTIWDISTSTYGNCKVTSSSGAMTLTVDNQSISGDLTITDDLACDDLTVSGTTKVGTLNGLIKGSSGTLSAATADTDYLAPNASTFTNTINAAITNLSVVVFKGRVTSVTINGVTKP